jgi:hexosaminidase
MKKIYGLVFSLMFPMILLGQGITPSLAIIPEPVSVTEGNGHFTLPRHVSIWASRDSNMAEVISFLREKLSVATGRQVTMGASGTATVKLLLNQTPQTELGNEGYRLSVTASHIEIRANDPAGLFYGVQTLLQLFPKEIESPVAVPGVSWFAPCVEILDYPRFQWRGLMLDVCRHFFTKQEVELYIDQMVRFKYNLLHLHLTDDQGWRIQIRGLPKLTEVGAWNVKKVGYFGTFSVPSPDEPRDYGGFYTQQDIRDIVQYAKKRFVNILPEVDVPGHSLAAVVSYPELSSTPAASQYHVSSGEELPEDSIDNTLDPSNEKVYAFLDKVLTQVAQLFPFGYIHMGGDECNKYFWNKNDSVKALMQREGLHNMDEVQSYFEKRVEQIVESKGKKFMGWDEILQGGVAPNAIVMSWRGMDGGIKAARMGHEVVMSPTTFAYLDYMQGDATIEPHVYSTLTLSKAYQFEPLPDSVDPKFILGGQANLWTEQVYNMRHAEYMTWPRGWAIAECLWSPKELRNWDDFFARTEVQFDRYDEAGINYAPSVYDPKFHVTKTADGELQVEMNMEVKGLDIYYSFDNSFPDRFYPKYTDPILVPKDAYMLKVITYKGNTPIGRMIYMPISVLARRTGRE